LEDLEVSFTNPDPSFWRGKRVLVTGHSGFKGSWMVLWLNRLGAHAIGISLPPSTTPSLFALAKLDRDCETHFADIREVAATAAAVRVAAPEIVFHLAAQPLVRASYRAPVETFATNVLGTAHVLDALRAVDSVRVVVAITTDKVYENCETLYPYRETDRLGGHDPYSASKAAAEMVIASYRDAFLAERGVAVASARAGNVIGGGDWSEDRLIPDAVRAWAKGATLEVRRPAATRPWQHVLDPLAAYLRLAEQLSRQPLLAGAYNFGPETHDATTVRDVVEMARSAYGEGTIAWGDGTHGPHEAGWLALEIAKARTTLGVRPRWPLVTTVRRTLHWYRAESEGADARALCNADIAAYEASTTGTTDP
jgi:CDP-glucose 4,6-dehydratase